MKTLASKMRLHGLGVWIALMSGTALGRAAEGDDVVLRPLYPKTASFEIEAGAGFVLNPTFVNTQLGIATIRYHWSESWGLGVRVGIARTQDRPERACIESFYNRDPDHQGGAVCAAMDGGAGGKEAGVNVGPAYMAIRELKSLAMATADYSLAYGKQILLYGATNHFDLRVRMGAGVLQAVDYPERTTVLGDDARPARGNPADAGVSVDDGDKYGIAARPDPLQVYAPAVLLGLVEEYHFARRFFLSGELSGYLTTGIDGGIDPFFVAQVNLGVRF
jgi:hypothetical protein